MRLLLSGDGRSEREEREAVVAADAALPGRLEGMRVSGEEEGGGLEGGRGTWDGRAETRKGRTRNIL